MKIGSLFSGYGGLDLAVQSAIGGTLAWVSDIEPGPSRILAHHHPDVPNLGDITTVDWTQVEPVDIICGGSPCQDLSHAGRRAGMRDGTRSGLWASMCEAIETIRPAYVIWENVLGALSASAASDMGPCEFGMGCEGSVPLRALGRVLGDLAEIGYDATWTTLAAADIGAPHQRERVFVLAWPTADATCDAGRLEHGDGQATADSHLAGPQGSHDQARTSPARFGGHAQSRAGGPDLTLLPTPDAQMGNGGRVQSLESLREGRRQVHMNDLPRLLLPTPSVADVEGGRKSRSGARSDELLLNGLAHQQRFGQYAPAIARWEALTRPAPAPTQPSARTGRPQLSARFVEWMMGLPAGHVTDPAIWTGLTPTAARNMQLRALGNGVVPQQCEAALRWLLRVRHIALTREEAV